MKSLRFIWLLSFFMPLQTIKAAAQEQESLRIAIVGAGASGLTAAFQLKQMGYKQITVYEKEDRVGGKVDTYQHGSALFELGAFWAGNTYSTVLAMADHYGLVYAKDEANIMVLSGDRYYPYKDSFFLRRGLAQLPLAALQAHRVYHRFQDDFLKVGLHGIDPELYMNFAAFAKKYHIELLAEVFRPFWVACGYGYYEDIPAIYVLKLLMPLTTDSSQFIVRNLSFSHYADGLYRFRDGYETLFEAIAADLDDLRLKSAVTSVRRELRDGRPLIQVTANGVTEEFDRLIVSTDLRKSRYFMDLTEEEAQLFGKIRSIAYNLHLLKAEGLPYPSGTMVLFDDNGTAEKSGHLIAILNREESKDLWLMAQIARAGTENTSALNLALSDMQALGASNMKVEQSRYWDYFPHVSSEDLAAGFYERLEALQGQKGIYYVGGIMNFETVEGSAAYAQDLVRRKF